MKTLWIIFFVGGIFPSVYAQNNDQGLSINEAVNEIASKSYVRNFTPPHILFDTTGMRQSDPYLVLRDNATNNELILLLNHPRSIVKCYAFRTLVLRKEVCVSRIIERHLKDSSTVMVSGSCTFRGTTVAEYMLQQIHYRNEFFSTQGYLSKDETTYIDSLLLYSNGLNISHRNKLFHQINPNAKTYSRLIEIVEAEQNPHALIALAKFQNIETISFIQTFLKNEETENEAIEAIREFPLPDFYPYLVEIFEREYSNEKMDKNKWRILYQALAQYPYPKTLRLFEKGLDQDDMYVKEGHSECLAIALRKYPNSIWESLKDKFSFDYFADTYINYFSKQCH